MITVINNALVLGNQKVFPFELQKLLSHLIYIRAVSLWAKARKGESLQTSSKPQKALQHHEKLFKTFLIVPELMQKISKPFSPSNIKFLTKINVWAVSSRARYILLVTIRGWSFSIFLVIFQYHIMQDSEWGIILKHNLNIWYTMLRQQEYRIQFETVVQQQLSRNRPKTANITTL